jgi:hypothetical protein
VAICSLPSLNMIFSSKPISGTNFFRAFVEQDYLCGEIQRMRIAPCEPSCHAKVPSHIRRFGRLLCSLPWAIFQVGTTSRFPRPSLGAGTSDLSQSTMLEGIDIRRTEEFEKALSKLFNEEAISGCCFSIRCSSQYLLRNLDKQTYLQPS